jgi:hypothetical protein
LFVVGDGAPLTRGLKSSLQTSLYYGFITGLDMTTPFFNKPLQAQSSQSRELRGDKEIRGAIDADLYYSAKAKEWRGDGEIEGD